MEKTKQKILDLLKELGVPANLLGRDYTVCAVMLLQQSKKGSVRITKDIYPGVAKTFATTPSRVERAIRHAVEVAVDRGEMETLNRVFGNTVSPMHGKPTNQEFLWACVDEIGAGA